MAALDFPPSPLINDKYPVPAVPGVPQYTFDGVKWTTVGPQITNAKAADAAPLMNAATAAIGTATDYAREDHVHPSDTSKLTRGGMLASINLDTAVNPGSYSCESVSNGPPGATGQGYLLVETYGNDPAYVGQRYLDLITGMFWTRIRVTSVWKAWRAVVDTEPQTLTAAQQTIARENIAVPKKNYIINGAMMVSQENGSTVSTAAGEWYPADQWRSNFAAMSGGAFTVSRLATVSLAGSPYRLRITVTTAQTGTIPNVSFTQRIEGLRVADLRWGTPQAKSVVLQFGIRAPAGNYRAHIYNSDLTIAGGGTYTITAAQAGGSTTQQMVIPGVTTGTWLNDTAIGFQVIFYASINGTNNLFDTVGNIFELSDVSITEGTVAPPFAVPDYATELALCQRYFFSPGTALPLSAYGSATGGVTYGAWVGPVIMRTTPTVTGAWSGLTNATTGSAMRSDARTLMYYITSSAAGYYQATYTLTSLNARL